MRQLRSQKGFSLIELIIVIVLLGIIAGVTMRFLNNTVQGYVDTSLRDQLTRTGRIAVERVNRELRNAVPNSIRVNGNCIEFIPMVASAGYQDQDLVYLGTGTNSAPVPVNGINPASNLMDAFDLNFVPLGGTTYYIVVYPYGPGTGADDPYQAQNPGPLATFQAINVATPLPAGVTRLQSTNNHRFLRQSPQRRVFIATQPVSFCIAGNDLIRYENYGLLNIQPTPPAGGGQVLAREIQTVDAVIPFAAAFAYQAGTLVRNAVVSLDFRFMRNDHLGNANWARLYHEVQVRNVP